MTIERLAVVTGLATSEGVWRRFAELAKQPDPYVALANLSHGQATVDEVKSALKVDAIAQANIAVEEKISNSELGWVVVTLITVCLPLLGFLLLRSQIAYKEVLVVTAAKAIAPYQRIEDTDLLVKSMQAKSGAFRKKEEIVGRFSAVPVKAGATFSEGDLSPGTMPSPGHNTQLVSFQVLRLPKGFVTTLPRIVTLAPVMPDVSSPNGFPMDIIAFEVGDGTPTIVRAAVTDEEWKAIRYVLGRGDLALSVRIP